MSTARGRARRLTAAAVLLPAAASAALTSVRYDAAPLWRDEVYTLTTAGRGLPQMLELLVRRDAGLVGYYALVHLVLAVSHATWWFRLPSATASVLLAALVALLGRRVADRGTALVAGLLCAVSPVVYVHAQEARPYPLVLCAVVTTALLLLGPGAAGRQADGPGAAAPGPAPRNWPALAAVAALAVVLHPLVALPALAALFATTWCHLAEAQRSRLVVAGAPAAVIGGALVLVGSAQAVASPPARATAAAYAGFWRIAAAAPWDGWVVLALALAGAVVLWRRSPGLGRFLLAWGLAPVLAVTVLGLVGSYFNTRYASAAAPAVCVLAALVLVRGPRWLVTRVALPVAAGSRAVSWTAAAATALVPAVAVAVLVPAPLAFRAQPYVWDDPRGAARQLGEQVLPGDAVVFVGSVTRPMVSAYAPQGLLGARLDDALLASAAQDSATLGGREVPAAQRSGALGGHPRVWLVGTVATATRDLGRSTTSARAVMDGRELASRTDHGHLRVELWEARSAPS